MIGGLIHFASIISVEREKVSSRTSLEWNDLCISDLTFIGLVPASFTFNSLAVEIIVGSHPQMRSGSYQQSILSTQLPSSHEPSFSADGTERHMTLHFSPHLPVFTPLCHHASSHNYDTGQTYKWYPWWSNLLRQLFICKLCGIVESQLLDTLHYHHDLC